MEKGKEGTSGGKNYLPRGKQLDIRKYIPVKRPQLLVSIEVGKAERAGGPRMLTTWAAKCWGKCLRAEEEPRGGSHSDCKD